MQTRKKPIRKGKLEGEILREICEYLTTRDDLLFWRTNNTPIFGRNNAGEMTWRSMPKFTPKGIPDILVVYTGHLIGVEVKREKATLRTDQIIFSNRLTHYGADYFIARSVEDVQKGFKKLGIPA